VSDTAVPHVELLGVSKSFGATQAVTDVSLRIERGSVHALVGENGAGKSTLGKIVAGVFSPDRGVMRVNGASLRLRSPRDALAHGIAAVAQELVLIPGLSVAENVFLGIEPRRLGMTRSRALRQRFDALVDAAGFEVPADQPVGSLGTARRQEVEILRALSRAAQLIVMDEPSAALSAEETQTLHAIIRSISGAGGTVLLVSHFLREVLELADTVTILRDGALVRTSAASDETEVSLIEGMIGRSVAAQFPPKVRPSSRAPVLLSAKGLHAPGLHDVSLELRAGEIVGLAGLVGAGRTELARALFGAAKATDGQIEIGGRPRGRGAGPRAALRAGICMIPESRTDEGLILDRSVRENVTLPVLGRLSRLGVVRRRAERNLVRGAAERVGLPADQRAPTRTLSGGNQQKTVFARSVLCAPRVLLADEPTRGVDVGAKRAIYELLVSLAAEGMGVLLISSDLEEILGLAHRVLVMRAGKIVERLDGARMSEESIIRASFAVERAL
jgi:rhamnose transport system ATP-binding protein